MISKNEIFSGHIHYRVGQSIQSIAKNQSIMYNSDKTITSVLYVRTL